MFSRYDMLYWSNSYTIICHPYPNGHQGMFYQFYRYSFYNPLLVSTRTTLTAYFLVSSIGVHYRHTHTHTYTNTRTPTHTHTRTHWTLSFISMVHVVGSMSDGSYIGFYGVFVRFCWIFRLLHDRLVFWTIRLLPDILYFIIEHFKADALDLFKDMWSIS